jgi:Ser/Thr protein kinase RdoA (MazF antagonist)
MVLRGEVWQLHHGGRVVASLHVTEADFPWLRARVEPAPGFDAVAPLLAEESRLADALDDGVSAEWEAAHDRVRAATRLTRPDGRDVPEYLLHVDGSEAWWRCGDPPVDDDPRGVDPGR